MAFRIILHALRMLTGNLPVALRIALPLFVGVLMGNFYMGELAVVTPDYEANPEAAFKDLGVTMVGGLFQTAFFLWAAVAWHRFILLEETPRGLFVAPNLNGMGRYFVGGLITFLIVFLVVILVAIVGGIVFGIIAVTMDLGLNVATYMSGFLGGLLGIVISFRLSPMLPSAAIGPRMKWRDAWDTTRGTSGTIIVIALVTMLPAFLLGLIPQSLAAQSLPLALFLVSLINTVVFMFGFSVLTTIYGVFVEKRDLNA